MGRTSVAAPRDLYNYYGTYVSPQGRRMQGRDIPTVT